jgi:hypothetical protein
LVRNGGGAPVDLHLRYFRERSRDGEEAPEVIDLPGDSDIVELVEQPVPTSKRLEDLGRRLVPVLGDAAGLAADLGPGRIRKAVAVVRVFRATLGTPTGHALRVVARRIRRAIAGRLDALTVAEVRAIATRGTGLATADAPVPNLSGADVNGLVNAAKQELGGTVTRAKEFVKDIDALISKRSATVIAEGEVHQVTLRFTLQDKEQPSQLNGTLLVAGGEPATSAAPAMVSLEGVAKPGTGVQFVPKKSVVQVTCWVPKFLCQGSSEVRLQGPGVTELTRDMEKAGYAAPSAPLARDGWQGTSVTLEGLHVEAGNPDVATAKLEPDGDPAPGSYKGSLPVSLLSAEATTLEVELNTRLAPFWPLLPIFLGILAAGLLLHHLGLRRRKTLINLALRGMGERYCDERDRYRTPEHPERDPVPIWSLDEVIRCPVEEDKKWTLADPISSAGSVLAAVHWARNDADLDEAQDAALLLVGRIANWRLILAEIGDLAEVVRDEPGSRRDEWARTRTAHDTAILLEAAKREPADAAAALELCARIKRQIKWHTAYALAWDLRAFLFSHPEIRDELAKMPLDALDKAGPAAETRKPAEQDGLIYDLDLLYRGMRALADVPAERFPERLGPELLQPPATSPLRRSVRIIDRLGSKPDQAFALLAPAAASPARGAAKAYRRAARAGQPLPDTPPEAPSGEKPPLRVRVRRSALEEFRQLLWVDRLLTLAILLLTSVVYLTTVYDDSWGSVMDWLTAFGAGFTGQVAVKWAALPLYRSVRLRAASTAKPDAKPEAEPTQPAAA